MIKKVEARVSIWVNRMLSRGGRLVLLKSILESIPIFWTSLVVAPKGILTKICKISFQFLWSGPCVSGGIPLVKWSHVALPKELGGWGLKNIYTFAQALADKSLWRFIQNNSLWGRVLKSKYLPRQSIVEWIRQPHKSSKGSIISRALVSSFPLVGPWVVWQVGNGKEIRLGEDPWLGSKNHYHFS